MSRTTYQLVNPVIEGTFNDTVNAANPLQGAEKMWNRFTEHVAGHVPKFMFSMRDVEKEKDYHFEVKEKRSDGSYNIKELQGLNTSTAAIDAYHKQIDAVTENTKSKSKSNKKGGANPSEPIETKKRYKKFKDDSSSTDSDSSDYYRPYSKKYISSYVDFQPIYTTPIAMLHYSTKFYFQSDGRVFEHKSTSNPNPVILNVPTYPPVVPVMPLGDIIVTKSNFTSFPVFKTPLLPQIVIWN